LDSALSDCNQLLRLAPNNALPLSNRRLIELLTEQYDKAVLACDVALKLNPKSAFSLFGRGIVELRRTMRKQALPMSG